MRKMKGKEERKEGRETDYRKEAMDAGFGRARMQILQGNCADLYWVLNLTNTEPQPYFDWTAFFYSLWACMHLELTVLCSWTVHPKIHKNGCGCQESTRNRCNHWSGLKAEATNVSHISFTLIADYETWVIRQMEGTALIETKHCNMGRN